MNMLIEQKKIADLAEGEKFTFNEKVFKRGRQVSATVFECKDEYDRGLLFRFDVLVTLVKEIV